MKLFFLLFMQKIPVVGNFRSTLAVSINIGMHAILEKLEYQQIHGYGQPDGSGVPKAIAVAATNCLALPAFLEADGLNWGVVQLRTKLC